MRNRIALFLLLACGLAAWRAECETADATAAAVAAPAADRRGEEQTFLTFPEWFLVFSPAEYAQFVRTHSPDEFCFWGHIGQLWSSYGAVIHQTQARGEPTNWGYHVMIMVISVSTTVEYAIRSAYEQTIGRISAAVSGGRTAEDDYGARVAQEYVDFIRVRPWYEFGFMTRLKGLWTQTSLFGPHPVRKLERRYALTTEYLVKGAYGKLIEISTHAAYETPIVTTTVLVDEWPACAAVPPGVEVPERGDGGATLLRLPRYQGFMTPATALADCGAGFREIAGNRGVIVLSAQGAIGQPAPAGAEVMMRQPIITQPGREREVLIVPVPALAPVLRGLSSQGLTLEHVFDY